MTLFNGSFNRKCIGYNINCAGDFTKTNQINANTFGVETDANGEETLITS